MAINTINEVKINKISSTQFETEKTGGNITPTMETNEVFIFTDDKVFTQDEKTKLAGIASNANNYVLPSDVVQDSQYVHTENNYSTADKTKLAGISSNADVSTITGIKKNGTTVNPVNKVVDIEVPTKTSDLTNDSNFVSDANYNHTDSCFTETEKTKLAGIETAAEVNIIEEVKVNGITLSPTAKVINIEVPTAVTKIWS